MPTATLSSPHRSIFSPSTAPERARNFEDYWEFSQRHSGAILELDKNLTEKRAKLADFQARPVRARCPLPDPDLFYRNYIKVRDKLDAFDRKTLLLTCIYKFARHEWVGISGAWDAIPSMAEDKTTKERISRYHLCEEFCHVRYFDEMLRIFHLDRFEWVPLGTLMNRVYRLFPKVPEPLMSPIAFVTELMGITFYQHVDRLLDDILADEPEARDRVRELLYEIMVDELAHIGQRRNFVGPLGIRFARLITGLLIRAFFKNIPESALLFDVGAMAREARAFDYGGLPAGLLERSWIPSYCRAAVTPSPAA